MSNIKLGVSLFSFSTDFVKGNLSLEDCVRSAAEIGAEGFELVGATMLPSYPYASDKVVKEFKAMTDHYGIKFVSYGASSDRGVITGRDLTDDELIQSAILDIKTANKLGCEMMRAQPSLSPAAIEKLATYAENYGVKVGVEIHNPQIPSSPRVQEYVEVFEKLGSDYIGLVPDFGCFATKPNKVYWDEALEKGAPLELLEMAANLRYDGVSRDEARERLLDAGANDAVMGAFQGMYGFVQFTRNPDLEGLKNIMPHVMYFHGKFHYMYEHLEEASIPYGDILPVIKNSNFKGYIMSEYEASDHAVEMTKRHLQMERKILDNC
ncbi:sugar phosphate isomerase/epimerase family protein [Metabacillus endolithicus]|uniref:Sugar phosphate isomerase/epimerase family protein n=1 Tax=Metabacillus endolithicus TaxID=1535204 RepID=A0ABW5C0A1_9BACI|nr:TIM barrel protein [Metabacillus endolithicus]UPG62616.1 sugar phosphate isomerase/epimerase [Metabacillus endolithicus]